MGGAGFAHGRHYIMAVLHLEGHRAGGIRQKRWTLSYVAVSTGKILCTQDMEYIDFLTSSQPALLGSKWP